MRVIVFVKATKDSEAAVMPTEALLREMGAYNERLVKAGIMEAGEGLHPSSRAKRIRFDGKNQTTVLDGPFAETKELVSGFWIWKVKSMEEAVAWLQQAPFGAGQELDIRPIFSAEDFGEAYTPDLQARDEELRAELERQKNTP